MGYHISKMYAGSNAQFSLVILHIISIDNLFAIRLRWFADAQQRVPPGNRWSGGGRRADAQKCVPPGIFAVIKLSYVVAECRIRQR